MFSNQNGKQCDENDHQNKNNQSQQLPSAITPAHVGAQLCRCPFKSTRAHLQIGCFDLKRVNRFASLEELLNILTSNLKGKIVRKNPETWHTYVHK